MEKLVIQRNLNSEVIISMSNLRIPIVILMAEPSELDWIAQKASELLVDKVKDGPLTDRDVKLAFEIFVQPRLKRLLGAFADEREREQAIDQIMKKLQEHARRLNAEHWKKSEL